MLPPMNASASARPPVTGTLVMRGISGSVATDWTRPASLSRNARRTTGGRLRTGTRRGSMQAIFRAAELGTWPGAPYRCLSLGEESFS